MDRENRYEKRKEKLTQSEAYLSISQADGAFSPQGRPRPELLDWSPGERSPAAGEDKSVGRDVPRTIAQRRRIHVPALSIPKPMTPRTPRIGSARSGRSSARSDLGELSERDRPASQMMTYLAVASVVAAVGAMGAYAWRRYHNRKAQ